MSGGPTEVDGRLAAHSLTEAAPLTLTADPIQPLDEGPVLVAGRYRLLSLLGAGAMGTVYRASDTELDEIVALKVLKKELAGSADMLERFRREVKLARRVTHRNVARTFDIGEHLGDRFLTMEFIEGQMLALRLERFGRLDVHEAAAIARDVAGGLAAAHAAGVVHRDLKPENVVIATDGRAVITDFGIARALAEAEQARGASLRGRAAATFAGAIVGTPAYMAPEQVEGRPDLDARADLYALGVMLYELATGETPWPGDSAFSVAAARLLSPPPDPRRIVADLPDTFVAIVHKLMARDRDERFSSAEETARALAVLGSGPTRTAVAVPRAPVRIAQKRLAVLPIANLGDAADDYLASAVGDELSDRLATLPGVSVALRGDAQRQAGVDAREAGRALGVDAVISGSVRRTGKSVKIALRLVTVQDGFQLWSRHLDAVDGGLLLAIDEMVSTITQTLSTDRVTMSRQTISDPVAQTLYLRVRQSLNTGWWGFTQESVDAIRRAHQLAPGDPRIAGTLALILIRGFANDNQPKEILREARRAIEIACEVDPEQPEARVARGLLNLANNEAAAAVAELQRALAFAPNSVDALDGLGRILSDVGAIERADAFLQRAIAIQPSLLAVNHLMARTRVLLGDYEAADALLGDAPDDVMARFGWVLMKARFLTWRNDPLGRAVLEDFIRECDSKLTSRGPFIELAKVLAKTQSPGEMRADLDRVIPTKGPNTPRRAAFNAQLQAEAFASRGYMTEAIEAIRMADVHGFVDIFWLQRCKLFDPLRANPELEAIRERTEVRAQRVIDAMDNG